MDVHLSRDGVPVVIHDSTLDRTTNGQGKVAAFDIADLQLLNAGGGETLPTLHDVLELVSGRAHVDIEVKAGPAAEAVLDEVANHPDLAWVMSSFDHDVLRYVQSAEPHVELWPLTVGASDEVLATAAALNRSVIAISDAGLDEDVAQYINREGFKSWVWTVNDPQRARILMTWPVIGICTDDPARLLGIGGGFNRD